MSDRPVYDKFQVRLFLADAFAKAVRETPYDGVLEPIVDVLKKHDATLSCQFDEFARFVAASEAHGDGNTPLARWTRDVMAKPDKQAYYKSVFTVAVKGEQLFDAAVADRLEMDFAPLLERGIVTRIRRTSNDPARNPQPPKRFG